MKRFFILMSISTINLFGDITFPLPNGDIQVFYRNLNNAHFELATCDKTETISRDCSKSPKLSLEYYQYYRLLNYAPFPNPSEYYSPAIGYPNIESIYETMQLSMPYDYNYDDTAVLKAEVDRILRKGAYVENETYAEHIMKTFVCVTASGIAYKVIGKYLATPKLYTEAEVLEALKKAAEATKEPNGECLVQHITVNGNTACWANFFLLAKLRNRTLLVPFQK